MYILFSLFSLLFSYVLLLIFAQPSRARHLCHPFSPQQCVPHVKTRTHTHMHTHTHTHAHRHTHTHTHTHPHTHTHTHTPPSLTSTQPPPAVPAAPAHPLRAKRTLEEAVRDSMTGPDGSDRVRRSGKRKSFEHASKTDVAAARRGVIDMDHSDDAGDVDVDKPAAASGRRLNKRASSEHASTPASHASDGRWPREFGPARNSKGETPLHTACIRCDYV
jgi:hypothetical protein